jgi:hypothetical protein
MHDGNLIAVPDKFRNCAGATFQKRWTLKARPA